MKHKLPSLLLLAVFCDVGIAQRPTDPNFEKKEYIVWFKASYSPKTAYHRYYGKALEPGDRFGLLGRYFTKRLNSTQVKRWRIHPWVEFVTENLRATPVDSQVQHSETPGSGERRFWPQRAGRPKIVLAASVKML